MLEGGPASPLLFLFLSLFEQGNKIFVHGTSSLSS